LDEIPPRCKQCGELLRPDVVRFGESLDPNVLQAAIAATEQARTMIVIGTSALVYPAAALPLLAKENGARLIEVNPDETPLSPYADEVLRGPAALELPRWWASQHAEDDRRFFPQ
jgi:NAD-dependent deacetylase